MTVAACRPHWRLNRHCTNLLPPPNSYFERLQAFDPVELSGAIPGAAIQPSIDEPMMVEQGPDDRTQGSNRTDPRSPEPTIPASDQPIVNPPGGATVKRGCLHSHAPFVYWLAAALRPQVVVDLAACGVCHAALCEAVSNAGNAGRCIAVVPADERNPDNDQDETASRLQSVHRSRFGAVSEIVNTEMEAAPAQFSDNSIDLLAMDARCGGDAVDRMIQSWQRKLSSRAIVLIHDADPSRTELRCPRVVQMPAPNWRRFEFSPGRCLDVLSIGDHVPSEIADLCFGDDPAMAGFIARGGFFAPVVQPIPPPTTRRRGTTHPPCNTDRRPP